MAPNTVETTRREEDETLIAAAWLLVGELSSNERDGAKLVVEGFTTLPVPEKWTQRRKAAVRWAQQELRGQNPDDPQIRVVRREAHRHGHHTPARLYDRQLASTGIAKMDRGLGQARARLSSDLVRTTLELAHEEGYRLIGENREPEAAVIRDLRSRGLITNKRSREWSGHFTDIVFALRVAEAMRQSEPDTSGLEPWEQALLEG